MGSGQAEVRALRTAIFVDFDNMYGGLSDMDVGAAEAFATNPDRLLSWLERGQDIDGPFRRRFLLKACYLNPEVFRRYRSYFVSAGFRVVDCPSLTQKGKSAADIHLVLDVMDALDHRTEFDEFIICSADADFTPLMVRLRAHDRRTVMVAAGPSATAYQSVCDEAVTPIQIAEALGTDTPSPAQRTTPGDADDPTDPLSGPGADRGTSTGPLTDQEISTAATAVREAVEANDGALPGASAAGSAIGVVPRIAQVRWGESDGFAGFVARHLPELSLVRADSGGWLIDASRRSADEILPGNRPDDLPSQVSRVTKVPRLDSEQYAALFQELSELSHQPPPLNRMGADIRERAAARGVAVPRSAANFVIQGLIYAGADPRAGEHDARYFAQRWHENVLLLCERAGIEIDADGQAELETWLVGALPPPG